MRIKVIGLGGIGTCLLRVLLKFLHHHARETGEGICITFIDGDAYTEENNDRQFIPALQNKAESWRTQEEVRSTALTYEAYGVYVTPENVFEFIREGDVVFLCVDNHATRKLVSDRCEELNDVVVFSGGNELTDGNVQVFVRKGEENVTLPFANQFHPEIEQPTDRNPVALSCEERAAREPQLLIMNNAIAATMLNVFYAWLQGKPLPDEIYVDIVTGSSRAVVRQKVARVQQ